MGGRHTWPTQLGTGAGRVLISSPTSLEWQTLNYVRCLPEVDKKGLCNPGLKAMQDSVVDWSSGPRLRWRMLQDDANSDYWAPVYVYFLDSKYSELRETIWKRESAVERREFLVETVSGTQFLVETVRACTWDFLVWWNSSTCRSLDSLDI